MNRSCYYQLFALISTLIYYHAFPSVQSRLFVLHKQFMQRPFSSIEAHQHPAPPTHYARGRDFARTLTRIVCYSLLVIPNFAGLSVADDLDNVRELRPLQIVEETEKVDQAKETKNIIRTIEKRLNPLYSMRKVITDSDISLCREKILTLKAYLDEAEREVFNQNWKNLQVYLTTLAEQEETFATLIEGLFPSDDPVDVAATEAMTFEAQTIYYALDDLRDAAKNKDVLAAQKAYARLLLSYDHFLKAGDLYPDYDPIPSTEVFFANTPRSTLKFDTESEIHIKDVAVLMSGPDMGKTGTVIYIDGDMAVIKLDPDGRAYQEVKSVQYSSLAKADPISKKKVVKKPSVPKPTDASLPSD